MTRGRRTVTPSSALNRRSFLARSAAITAVPAVGILAGGALAQPASAETLPDHAPIPPSALGPAVNAQGYYVGRVEKNLYWVTDGTYQATFLTSRGRPGRRQAWCHDVADRLGMAPGSL
jgi:hypothetical protein